MEAFRYYPEHSGDIVLDELPDCDAFSSPTKPWFIYAEKPAISVSSVLFSKRIKMEMTIVETALGLFPPYRNHSEAKLCSAKMTGQTPRPSFISQYRLLCLVSGLSSGLPLLMLDSLTATSNAKCHLSKSKSTFQ